MSLQDSTSAQECNPAKLGIVFRQSISRETSVLAKAFLVSEH